MPANVSIPDKKIIFDALSSRLSHLTNGQDLFAAYEALKEELKSDLPEFDQITVINSFKPSFKLPVILSETTIIYGSLSGAISTLLPELITQGLIVANFTTIACITFIVPALFAAPFFFYQLTQHSNQEEYMLRIEELILNAQKHIVEQYSKEKHMYMMGVSINPRHIEMEFKPHSVLTKRMLLDAISLFMTVFALGIAILITFSLSNPLSWALITVGGVVFGGLYALFEMNQKRNLDKKRFELNKLHTTIEKVSRNLFTDERLAEAEIHKNKLEQNLTESNETNKQLANQVKQLEDQLQGQSKKIAALKQRFFKPAHNDDYSSFGQIPRPKSR